MALSLYIYYHTDYDNDSLPIDGAEGVAGAPLTEDLLPELQDENYLFQGWYSTPTFDPESKVIVGSVFDKTLNLLHLYAKWIPKNELGNKMTLLANEIRELSGTTAAIGLDTMKTHVSEANNEVESQTKLLTQIIAALEGKVVGGGSGSDNNGNTGELVAITLESGDLGTTIVNVLYTGANQEYNILQLELGINSEEQTIEVMKNSIFIIAKNIELKSSGLLIMNKPYIYIAVDDTSIDIANQL